MEKPMAMGGRRGGGKLHKPPGERLGHVRRFSAHQPEEEKKKGRRPLLCGGCFV